VLNDHERKALSEVERRLIDDDPGFARNFEAHQTRLQRDPRRRGNVIAVVVAVLLAALMLLAGSVLGALTTGATTVLIWALWHRSVGAGPDGT
jgi:hypothetical protein